MKQQAASHELLAASKIQRLKARS